MNKITQVSEASLRRLNRYLHSYTFFQLTLLTSFAGDGISNQEREYVGLRKRASVSGIRNNDTAYFQLLAYVSRNYHVPLYSRL